MNRSARFNRRNSASAKVGSADSSAPGFQSVWASGRAEHGDSRAAGTGPVADLPAGSDKQSESIRAGPQLGLQALALPEPGVPGFRASDLTPEVLGLLAAISGFWVPASPSTRALLLEVAMNLSQLTCGELATLPFCGSVYMFEEESATHPFDRVLICIGGYDESMTLEFAAVMKKPVRQIAEFQSLFHAFLDDRGIEDDVPPAMSRYLEMFLSFTRQGQLELLLMHVALQLPSEEC